MCLESLRENNPSRGVAEAEFLAQYSTGSLGRKIDMRDDMGDLANSQGFKLSRIQTLATWAEISDSLRSAMAVSG